MFSWPGTSTLILMRVAQAGFPSRILGAVLATWALCSCANMRSVGSVSCPKVAPRVEPLHPCERNKPSVSLARLAFETLATLKVCVECNLQSLSQRVATTPDDASEKPELLFRLAETYAELAGLTMLRVEDCEQDIALAIQKGDTVRAERLRCLWQRLTSQKAQLWASALDGYTQLVGSPRYRQFERIPEALSFVVFSALQLGDVVTAQNALLRLKNGYPNSRIVSIALLSFADHNFARQKYATALVYYDLVHRNGDGSLEGYALYMQAWLSYVQGDYPRALAKFGDFFALPKERKGWGYGRLAREARRDLVQAYSHSRSPEDAAAYFGQRFGGDAKALLDQLGELYRCRGDLVASRSVVPPSAKD